MLVTLKNYKKLNFNPLLLNFSFKKMLIQNRIKPSHLIGITLIKSKRWQIFDGISVFHKNHKKFTKFPFQDKVKILVKVLALSWRGKITTNQKVSVKAAILKFFWIFENYHSFFCNLTFKIIWIFLTSIEIPLIKEYK